MSIYFTEITILHISCCYYEYRSYILIILMCVYSLKSSKYGIASTQIYYIIRGSDIYFHVIVYGEIGQRDVRRITIETWWRIRITIKIRVVVLQKVRIWVMVRVIWLGFPKKTLVSCICLHGKWVSSWNAFNCEWFTTFSDLNKHLTRSQWKKNRHRGETFPGKVP
jgi:hypothetical protein